MLLSGKRTYPVADALAGLPLVADLCDATSSRLRRQARHAPMARRLPLALEYLEVRRVERALVRRAQHVLFASERDREAIMGRGPEAAGQARATVVPNGVDLDVWHRTAPSLGSAIVLTGAMDYPPNADAAIQLATEILPIVRRDAPEAEVLVVGRDPTPEVQALADHPGVTVTGFVDDVRPYLEQAAVFAAPIRFGAGIQNKVLEAMAMEVPVVASPLAADGLRTTGGRTPPIDIASTPAAFAAAILRRYRAASTTGPDVALRTYVAEEFDWARQAARVSDLLEDAAAHAPDPLATSEPATDPVPER
jgi:glycosyltransferase involved in cell wall biosynthesis